MNILKWTAVPANERDARQEEFRKIFFETSARREFADAAAKEDFWTKWTAYYFLNQPQYIYVAIEANAIKGYLTGCPDSIKALDDLGAVNPSYGVFADLFARFPAHLHINLTERVRGKGYGRRLIEAFLLDLAEERCSGVHIVTSPSADNVAFYRKLSFNHLDEREWKGTPLLLMGKSL